MYFGSQAAWRAAIRTGVRLGIAPASIGELRGSCSCSAACRAGSERVESLMWIQRASKPIAPVFLSLFSTRRKKFRSIAKDVRESWGHTLIAKSFDTDDKPLAHGLVRDLEATAALTARPRGGAKSPGFMLLRSFSRGC